MQPCGAKTRSGGKCKNAPMANGRCRMHGGKAGRPITHGRYSRVIPQKIRDRMEALEETNPLELLDELTLQRALFADYLARFDTSNVTALDIGFLFNWLSDIGRMVERIIKIRNETALTAAEVTYLKARAVDVALKYFPNDEGRQEQFILDLFGGAGNQRAGYPALTAAEADDD